MGTSVDAFLWSPDSHRLASAGEIGKNGVLTFWDAATGEQLSTVTLRRGANKGLTWSPDGGRVAVAVRKDIQIVEAAIGRECHLLKGHADFVTSIAWSPDGKGLASAANDAAVKTWDAASGRVTRTLLAHAGPVRSIAWHRDGNRLVSSGGDKTVIIWEPASGLAICLLTGHKEGVTWVAWSADGTRLASSDTAGRIRILDSTPGRVAVEKQKWAQSEQAETGKQPAKPPR